MLNSPETLLPMLWIDTTEATTSRVSNALSSLPVQCHFASTFEQARHYLNHHPIELVVLDLALETNPHQETCFQFADWLRQESPYNYVDLMLTSGYYTKEHYGTITLLRYQALDFWEKPYEVEHWRRWLDAYIQGNDLPKLAALKALSSHPDESSPHRGRLALESLNSHEPSWPPLRPPSTPSSPYQDRSLSAYAPSTTSPTAWPKPPSQQDSESQARIVYQEANRAFHRRDFARAHQCYQEAFQLDAHPRYQMFQAWSLYLLHPHDSQIVQSVHHTLYQLAQQHPTLEQAHLFLGQIYVNQGQPDEALRWYEYMLAQNPHLQEVAQAYRRLKRSTHAIHTQS